MKRGLITWDKTEISPAVFERRVTRLREVIGRAELPAVVVYSELWRSNQGRFFANYMPYTKHTDSIMQRLADLNPRTIAPMHGSAFAGDGSRSLRDLAVVMREVLG